MLVTQHLLVILLFLVTANCDGSFASTYAAGAKTLWSTFWDNVMSEFDKNDPACDDTFAYSALWDSAVAAKAITDSKDLNKTYLVAEGLINDFENPKGWFSATTAKDDDVYIDDNAQVMWVLLDAYETTRNRKFLKKAEKLMELIKAQWSDSTGGVRWSLNGDYIAAISTTEAALDAMKLYDINQDESLIPFASDCTDWIWNHLRDSDGLIFDGYTISSNNVNKGKLTYTVGTMISTLVRIAKHTQNSTATEQAYQLAKSSLGKNSTFYYSNGLWNNQLRYSHLFFIGLVDLINIGSSDSKYSDDRQNIADEIRKQASFIQDFLQFDTAAFVNDPYTATQDIYDHFAENYHPNNAFKPDPNHFCNNTVSDTPKKELIINSSAVQIMYAASQLKS